MPTATAAEKRRRAKLDYDAFLAECPTRDLLDRLSNKWVGLVICALEDGPRRHSELARAIAGVSQKMLTQTVRELERDGLVTRTVTPTVPVRVDYELTALGHDLRPIMHGLKQWAEGNMGRVQRARDSYDVATAP